MTTLTATTDQAAAPRPRSEDPRTPRIVSALSAALACAAIAGLIVLDVLAGDDAGTMTTSLSEHVGALRVIAAAAGFAGAGLFVALARLTDVLEGWRRHLTLAAGSAVTLLFVAYLSATTAGAEVAAGLLAVPGPGVGESTLLALNVLGVARYAPSLALAMAGALSGDRLPRWLRVFALVLAVASAVPFTGWIAALLLPVWLGIAGALARRPNPAR